MYETRGPFLKKENNGLRMKKSAAFRRIIDVKRYTPVSTSSVSNEPLYLSIKMYTVNRADHNNRLMNPARLTWKKLRSL